jgi:GEVED domain/Secretion system C-terminal sorting domain
MNKKALLLILCQLIMLVSFGQYCTAIGPSSDLDSNVESVSIVGESGTSISYTGCPAILGLEDLTTTENVTLIAGNSYTIYVQFGTCGNNFASAGNVYIDFNTDGVFDLSENVGDWAGTPPVALSSFNFTVPAGITDGVGRIRVLQDESSVNPVNPCASFTWGSAVDFGVTFTGGVDCIGYIGDDRNDPRMISALPFQESHNSSFCYSNQEPVYGSPDVFYQIDVSDFEVDYLKVSLCGSTFDTYLSVQDLDTNVLFINDDFDACSPQSQLTIPTIGLDTIFIIVQGWGIEAGDYDINIEEDISASLGNTRGTTLTLYPNPIVESFKILNLTTTADYLIYNELGQIIDNGKIKPDEAISIDELPAGIFYLKLSTLDEMKIFKLIVTE